jgi:hypothetical protein
LNVNVSNRSGAVMNDQLGKFVCGEPVALQQAIVAAHRTVMAVLAAVAGHFDNPAHEDAASEHFISNHPCLLVQEWSRSI